MADTTVKNDCLSIRMSIGPTPDFIDLTFGMPATGTGNGVTPLKWVVFTNEDAAESITLSFVGEAGGLLIGPGEVSPVLPGRWFGVSASNSGAGDVYMHILGGY